MPKSLLLAWFFGTFSVSPTALTAQTAEQTASPAGTAELFLRSIRAIRFDATARLLHPETVGRFHTLIRMIAEADSTGDVRRYLTDADAAAFSELDPPEVVSRSLGATIDGMPGLMHAVYDRDDTVVGAVMEGADSAHVVYRSLARISGAVPEVKVMQLARTAGGWRILWSDELEVLDAALRGVPRGRNRSPPGP
jgi:hypothetical protein